MILLYLIEVQHGISDQPLPYFAVFSKTSGSPKDIMYPALLPIVKGTFFMLIYKKVANGF